MRAPMPLGEGRFVVARLFTFFRGTSPRLLSELSSKNTTVCTSIEAQLMVGIEVLAIFHYY